MKTTKDDPNILEIMDILQEECAEVIQAVSKIRRFGSEAIGPYSRISNRGELETELGDLIQMIVLLSQYNFIDIDNILKHSTAKREKLKIWSSIKIPADTPAKKIF